MRISFRLFVLLLLVAVLLLGSHSLFFVPTTYAEDDPLETLRLKAEQGDAEAQCALGFGYELGKKDIPQDNKEAVKWYRKSAVQGDEGAQFYLGYMYRHGKGVPQDNKEAAKWYRKSANQGHPGAQLRLGIMCQYGIGVPQDYMQAAKWYKKSAEQGYAGAQFSLGLMYIDGEDIPQNYKEGFKYLKKAAEQGHARAQFRLGTLYGRGEGVPQNYKEAFKYYRKAAEKGNPAAQGCLGFMYRLGDGVPQDYVKAYAWFNLAVAQGEDPELRDGIVEFMTSQQIAAAQELSAQLLRKIEGSTDEPPSSMTNKDKLQIKGTGTGFIITKDGYILTCHHVIEGTDLINVQVSNETYNARLVREDPYNDLALLKIAGNFSAIAFSNKRSAKMGEEVFTIGYPNPVLQGINAKFTKGEVSSLTGCGDDLRLYQISVPVQPGNSGGPLLDMKGNVMGIIVAVLDAKVAFKITGEIPQNVNYAIKSNYALALLDTLPEVSDRMPSPKKKGTSFDKVVNHATGCTVMVVTY